MNQRPDPDRPMVWWLTVVSLEVKHLDETIEIYRTNIIVTTNDGFFSRANIAGAHESAHKRYETERVQRPGAQFIGATLENVSMLGQMSMREFHAGFEEFKTEPAKEEPKPTKQERSRLDS
jgi:hypothetical protein